MVLLWQAAGSLESPNPWGLKFSAQRFWYPFTPRQFFQTSENPTHLEKIKQINILYTVNKILVVKHDNKMGCRLLSLSSLHIL